MYFSIVILMMCAIVFYGGTIQLKVNSAIDAIRLYKKSVAGLVCVRPYDDTLDFEREILPVVEELNDILETIRIEKEMRSDSLETCESLMKYFKKVNAARKEKLMYVIGFEEKTIQMLDDATNSVNLVRDKYVTKLSRLNSSSLDAELISALKEALNG